METRAAGLRDATHRLLDYCRGRDWSGHDPYDGLNSRVFKAMPFLQSRWPRLVVIQSLKRCPINLRPLLAVPPGTNPKGIALFTSTLVRLSRDGITREQEARALADRLADLRTEGWPHACWGYNFDWQTRTYLVPRGYPNIICTTFAAEALLDAFDAYGDPRHLELAADAARFLLSDLRRSGNPDSFCFSYTPLRQSRVHNANLLGAALLARLHARLRTPEFRDAAIAAARYSLERQRPDGSWIYGDDPHQGWIDSFHTGYNLLALRSIATHLDHEPAARSLERGYKFYRDHFFAPGGIVKYYHDRVHPIDCHAVAHAILTLVQLRDMDPSAVSLAHEIAEWAIGNMRRADGAFCFQKWPHYTNRIAYMRWTQAWMLRGLAELLLHAESQPAAVPQAQAALPATQL